VFTARYGLSTYVTQIRYVPTGLISVPLDSPRLSERLKIADNKRFYVGHTAVLPTQCGQPIVTTFCGTLLWELLQRVSVS